ncbi:hypothetical protein F511_40633 [Dorcoceras hygrometricum]|uniref:Uncharacterized protein n=1 Tax=Dorcoceras hygrometricum TaxID=472368 RepID=A0A2Z7BBA8_9LAMI|nr:hypothetical protein F511_40633 [Dorcoceras hygrometricum]
MKNNFSYVSITIGRRSIKKNNIACVIIASHIQGEQRCLRQRYRRNTNHHENSTAYVIPSHRIQRKQICLLGTEEIIKKANAAVVISTVDADIAKVLEGKVWRLGVTATERESQGVDEALFEEDFARWLDDFVARHNEPELVSTNNEAQATGSINSVVDKEVNMPIDDLLIQISDDLLLPITTAEVTMIKLGAFSTSGDKGKGKLVEDEHVTASHAQELFALICRDVEVMVQVRDSVMQAVVDFFASFSLNNMPDIESLKDLKEKERLMLAWAETTTLAIAVRRQLFVLIKYRELLLRTVLESYQRYLTPDLPWNVMAVQVANLLSVAHSHSLEDLKAQQQELNIEMVQSHSSLPAIDYIDSGDVRLAHFYYIANSTCWVWPVILMDGVWTPVQGPDFWRSGCHLSLFLNKLRMPAPAIHEIFASHVSLIEPDQYWTTVPWLMSIWCWAKVCEEVVEFSLSGGLRPGLACNNFVDSVVKKDLGDTEEVFCTGVEEVDLVSSDVSTVYRSPSPPSPGVDSLENDLCFALGPAIFSRVEQEERLYFVQSPDSPPAVSPHHASSSSSTDVSLHFDSTDVPVHAQAATHAPASVDFTKLAETLEDLQSSLTQRIHDSNCEMLSKLNSVELGVRGDLLKMQSLLRQSFETACRVLERQGNTHTAQITDLKKGLMGPVGTIFADLFDIKKKQREQDARLTTMDEQIAAIRNEHLDFQSKIAADMLSLSTQVGDIADFLRSGAAKKGEIGSSSRPTAVRTQTQTLPPTTGTFEERVTQARRHIIETGQVISIEEAAERVIEADRREADREHCDVLSMHIDSDLVIYRTTLVRTFQVNSSVLLVQPDEGVSVLVVDRIGDYLPQSTEKSRRRRTRRSHDKNQCVRWTHTGRTLAAKPLLANRRAPRRVRCRASSPASCRNFGGRPLRRWALPRAIVAHRCTPPSRTTVALWGDESDAGRGVARRWMRARWRDDARCRALTCGLAAHVISDGGRRPAAAPAPLRRCRDGWSEFF